LDEFFGKLEMVIDPVREGIGTPLLRRDCQLTHIDGRTLLCDYLLKRLLSHLAVIDHLFSQPHLYLERIDLDGLRCYRILKRLHLLSGPSDDLLK
jgi:hypothetical protein